MHKSVEKNSVLHRQQSPLQGITSSYVLITATVPIHRLLGVLYGLCMVEHGTTQTAGMRERVYKQHVGARQPLMTEYEEVLIILHSQSPGKLFTTDYDKSPKIW